MKTILGKFVIHEQTLYKVRRRFQISWAWDETRATKVASGIVESVMIVHEFNYCVKRSKRNTRFPKPSFSAHVRSIRRKLADWLQSKLLKVHRGNISANMSLVVKCLKQKAKHHKDIAISYSPPRDLTFPKRAF